MRKKEIYFGNLLTGWSLRNWCFRIEVLGKTRVPWTERRSNQPILKEISPEYSLDGLVLKPELQYFAVLCEHSTHWKRPWGWERLKARREGDNRWDGWIASLTQWTWIWANSRMKKDREAWCAAVCGLQSWTQPGDWTITNDLDSFRWR